MPRHIRLLTAVCIGHLTNDVFASMTPVLLTFLAAGIMPMSNIQIGLAVSMAQLLGAITQPFFGIRADRSGGRRLGALGLAFHVGLFTLGVVLAAATRHYWLMFIPIVLAPIGSGALHPVGALHAAEAVPRRSAFNMALFFLMGQTGLALGPAIAGILLEWANPDLLGQMGRAVGVQHFGMQGNLSPIILLSVLSLPAIFLMASSIPRHHEHHEAQSIRQSRARKWRKASLPAIRLLDPGRHRFAARLGAAGLGRICARSLRAERLGPGRPTAPSPVRIGSLRPSPV